MKKTRKGFTLVELLIVIAILGVLATMMSLTAADQTPKARAAKIVADFRTIRSGLALYLIDSSDVSDKNKKTYFDLHSDDYLGGTLKKFTVTSEEINAEKGKYKWEATYKDTEGWTSAVKAAIKMASEDMNMIGTTNGVKMRVY